MLRVNAERRRVGHQATLPITHLVEGYLTRDQIIALLREDPVRGPLGGEVIAEGDSGIRIGDQSMEVVRVPAHEMVDWEKMGVWGVLEASGARVQERLAEEHRTQGKARKVVVTAPTKGGDGIAHTLIVGYNEHAYDPGKHHVLTNESCTTKSALHVAEALRKKFGLSAISLTTVHAETGPEKRDLIARSGRVEDLALLGFQPQSTGSQGALTKLFPNVDVSAEAYRVPVTDGSVSDITFKVERRASLSRAWEVLVTSVQPDIWQVVQTIRSSVDLIGNPHDAVVARDTLTVIGRNLVRVRAGYDNAYAPARAALDAMAYVRAHS